MEFEWEIEKAAANFAKHGVDFRDAARVFASAVVLGRSDRRDESRWVAVGRIRGVYVTIAFTKRGNAIRIISARRARESEKAVYRAHLDR